MARIGHAASAEDGSGFGMPGDQTGREVRFDYLGTDGNKWVYIYRYEKDATVANNIAEAVIQAVQNPHVGYSRETYTGWGLYHTRYGLWTAMHETGDIRKIEVNVNCDCSQLVSCACKIAGVPNVVREMVTASQDDILKKCGFVRYNYDVNAVVKGDVLWRSGHTAVVVEGAVAPESLGPSKTPKYRGRITEFTPVYRVAASSVLNLLLVHPALGKDNLVDVCDEEGDFYYVRIVDKYGFVPKGKLVKDEEKKEDVVLKIGDEVRFVGDAIYFTSYEKARSVPVSKFNGTINMIAEGSAHPYYVFSKSVDGWCDKKDLEKL